MGLPLTRIAFPSYTENVPDLIHKEIGSDRIHKGNRIDLIHRGNRIDWQASIGFRS